MICSLLPCRLKEELQCAQSSCDASNEQKARLETMLAKERRDGKNTQQVCVCVCVYGESFAPPQSLRKKPSLYYLKLIIAAVHKIVSGVRLKPTS